MRKVGIYGKGGGAVVRTTTLTLVTTENPTIQTYRVGCTVGLLLDRQARDTATCVDALCGYDCAVGTRLDTASALPATRPLEGPIITINLGVNNQLSEEYEGAKLGCYE